MADQERDLLVSYREHVATRDELRQKLQDLELRYERLSATLLHLPDKVDQLTSSVQELATAMIASTRKQPDPQVDQQTLAIHRMLDDLAKRSGGGAGGLERWLLLGLIGVAGWMAARFFIGG